MTGEDGKIWRRMVRRLKSARASVMYEFALVAPLVVMTAAFAADFTRILRTEQQLEIAARLGADVEAHMSDFHGGDCPTTTAKEIAKIYLMDLAQVSTNIGKLYMKGSADLVPNPASYFVTAITDFLKGEGPGGDNWFTKMLCKILGGAVNFLTFGTISYISEVVPHDRQVKVSMAAYIPTILPVKGYKWLNIVHEGRLSDGHDDSFPDIGVGQFAYDLEGDIGAGFWSLTLNPAKRHRVYCAMPVVDSTPIAPETYVRIIKSFFANFLKAFGL